MIPEAPRECAATLATRATLLETLAPTPPRSAALSQIVVHAEAPLAMLGERLEARLQRRLAQGRFGIGPAGSVRYSAERSDLSLAVRRDRLEVRTTVRARAAACRGENCYASCEPEAIATARVPLFLRRDYGFDPAHVALEFTRGCKIEALGGFLTVDVTPTLASQLEPELVQLASQIDQQLGSLRENVNRAWEQLSMPRKLPLGCLVLQPQSIVQGPLTDSTTTLRARFAILARPELRQTCTNLPGPPPLPALERDASMPDEGRVTLGLVRPLDDLRRALESESAVALDQRRVRVSRAKLSALGSDLLVELGVTGDVCGQLAFAASPSFAEDGAFLGLRRPRWLEGERERVSARGFNAELLLQGLAGVPRLGPLLSVATLPSAAPALAELLSTPELDVSAKVSSAQGAGAAAREDALVTWIAMRGRLELKAVSGAKRSAR